MSLCPLANSPFQIWTAFYPSNAGPFANFTENCLQAHTVLAINKFFRQIKAKIYQFCSNHIIKICFFWEKVFIPNHSKHDGLLVYWPKFIQFSHEITFGRGKSRIWVLEVNIWTPFFSKFDYFHQKTKTWSTLPSCSEPSA